MTHTEESLMALADQWAEGEPGCVPARDALRLAIREVLAERDALKHDIDRFLAFESPVQQRAEKAEAELAVYKDAKKPPLEQSQSNCLAWMNRCLNAEAECERLRKDAERYRWLRNDALQVLIEGPVVFATDKWGEIQKQANGLHIMLDGNELDAAIDAALKDQP